MGELVSDSFEVTLVEAHKALAVFFAEVDDFVSGT